jgi:hypothetical protein
LGFIVDTFEGIFCLTERQHSKLQAAIQVCLCDSRRVSAKLLAKVTGLVCSMALVTGSVSGLFSRYLHGALHMRTSWFSKLASDEPPACSELQFWRDNLARFSSRPIWRSNLILCVLNYDASATGWGGHLLVDGVMYEAHGSWAPRELHGEKSSTWRELQGLLLALRSVAPVLVGSAIVARGDNMNVYFILRKGGTSSPNLQAICLKIFWLYLDSNLIPEWVPRKENEQADYLSKIQDVDDFGLNPTCFELISRVFGPLEVDRFASEHNAKLTRFNAFY